VQAVRSKDILVLGLILGEPQPFVRQTDPARINAKIPSSMVDVQETLSSLILERGVALGGKKCVGEANCFGEEEKIA